jgi:hypothetical protein
MPTPRQVSLQATSVSKQIPGLWGRLDWNIIYPVVRLTWLFQPQASPTPTKYLHPSSKHISNMRCRHVQAKFCKRQAYSWLRLLNRSLSISRRMGAGHSTLDTQPTSHAAAGPVHLNHRYARVTLRFGNCGGTPLLKHQDR